MKKKFLFTGSALIAGAAVLGLSSCGGSDNVERTKKIEINPAYNYVEAPTAPSYSTDLGDVDIHLNYDNSNGITRNGEAINDPISGKQISKDSLLPLWTKMKDYAKVNVRCANGWKGKEEANYNAAITSNFDDELNLGNKIDLFYSKTKFINKDTSKFVDLTSHINETEMPNLYNYLQKNPDVRKMITTNGKILYTPYFDGKDDIERMFLMDTSMTEKVLDATSGWDESTKNGGTNPSANVVQGGYYQPFMDPEYNLPADTEVPVLFNQEVKTLTIKKTTNIIKQQNELLNREGGCTGKELAEQFINYIKTAYAEFFEKGYYKLDGVDTPSLLFTSDSAAYTADDLIALLRVVKANPQMITGDANKEIVTFFPRACSDNRVENIYDFAQIWGVQGLDSEKGSFYVGGDGKFHDLRTTQASYDALDYLSQVYNEGLFLKNFYTDDDGKADKTGNLDKYYKKTVANSGYGFMMYDYSAANVAANDAVAGIGTDPESRSGEFKGASIQGITAILAPLTYWATGDAWKHDDAITSRNGKSLLRYYESNRSLKDSSWAIPAASDNVAGAIRVMDFLFSDFGQLVNNYGPTEYWATPDGSKDSINGEVGAKPEEGKVYVADNLVASGELNPIINQRVKGQMATQTGDFWTYYRSYIGATHGIGNERQMGINVQATNPYGQFGVSNIQDAFTVGNNGVLGDGTVLKLATISKKKDSSNNTIYTWNTSAPAGFPDEYNDSAKTYAKINGFWSDKKSTKNEGWVATVTRHIGVDKNDASVVIKDTEGQVCSYNDVIAQFNGYNKTFLWTYAKSVDMKYVPDYAIDSTK